MPVAARHAPALVAALETDHGRLEGLQAELRALLPRTCSEVTAEREAAGQLLGRALTLLVADHLRHMDREETEAMPVLWAHLTEEELDAMDGQIRAAVPSAADAGDDAADASDDDDGRERPTPLRGRGPDAAAGVRPALRAGSRGAGSRALGPYRPACRPRHRGLTVAPRRMTAPGRGG